MSTPIQDTAERLKQSGIIAIVRGDFSVQHIVRAADALRAANVTAIEVTLNTPGVLQAIAQLRRTFSDSLLVGVGTVRTRAHAEQAVDAGAQFLVSPNFDAATVAFSQTREILHLPGVFTATEAQAAFAAGCRMVKLFPADLLGPAYLKALRAPLDDIEFVPTGGISARNISDYVRAGAAAVGVGSALLTDNSQSVEEIFARGAALRAAWEQAKYD
jgi:2-dehydro-3-deoxyphosphogluconate aldolase/(4S)-4-hydroxy-2-oxoglutarate aldolase